MARPRSEDKRQAILLAATQLFAEEGINAPTIRIAKAAGVSEGTIFTYFASKDELMNQLYLALKQQLRSTLVLPSPAVTLREQLWMAWRAYVNWGMKHPDEHRALAKLALSPRITQATRALANEAFCDVAHILEQAMTGGVLKNQSPDFVGALMGAMANTTMDFMVQNPIASEALCKDGFAAYWHAIS